MGTVNLIEAARSTAGIQAVVCITSDKCHESRKWYWGYYEDEPMRAGSLIPAAKVALN
jgi:CDP-glucose 4,6-dehydratase